MAVKAPTAKRFLVFAQWYLTPVGGVHTAIVVAGIVLALADRLPAAVLLLATGLLVVLPWKLSFHESSRANLVFKQNFLTEQAAQTSDQVTALNSQLAESTAQVRELKTQLAETTAQVRELKTQLAETTAQVPELKARIADVGEEASTKSHQARVDALGALAAARHEWGMLLRAEREQFASQLREYLPEQ